MRRSLLSAVVLGVVLSPVPVWADTTVVVDNQSVNPITAQVGTGTAQGIPRGLTNFNLTTGQVVTVFSARLLPPNGKICDHTSQPGGGNFIKLEVKDVNGRPACGSSCSF